MWVCLNFLPHGSHYFAFFKYESEVENSPQVLELRKRVKVLEGKLDKQKELTKSLEDSLKAQPKTPEHAADKGGVAGIKADAISSKV